MPRCNHQRQDAKASIVLSIVMGISLIADPAAGADRDPIAETAIAAAQSYLALQQAEDGSFGGQSTATSTTSAVLLSFLSTGHAPDVGRYGLLVRRAGDYLLKSIPDDGYIGKLDTGRMRAQSLAGLALAELLTVEADPQQRVRLRAAITRLSTILTRAQEIQRAEADAGGLALEYTGQECDAITTCGAVLALRAAKGIGVVLPQANFDRAVAYLKRCAIAEGGFAERPGGELSLAATYASITVLSLLDPQQSAPLITKSTQLVSRTPSANAPFAMIFFHLQSARLRSDAAWLTTWPADRDLIISRQVAGGSIAESPDQPEALRVFSTASAILALSSSSQLLMTFEK